MAVLGPAIYAFTQNAEEGVDARAEPAQDGGVWKAWMPNPHPNCTRSASDN